MPELPVEGVSEVLTSTRSVLLTWNSPPRYSWRGVIYYNVIVSETVTIVHTVSQLANNQDPSLASEPLQMEQFTVNDLEESFVYSFSIQIANDAGNGQSSAPVVQQMPEDGKGQVYTYIHAHEMFSRNSCQCHNFTIVYSTSSFWPSDKYHCH